jgi:hypothetical protein
VPGRRLAPTLDPPLLLSICYGSFSGYKVQRPTEGKENDIVMLVQMISRSLLAQYIREGTFDVCGVSLFCSNSKSRNGDLN